MKKYKKVLKDELDKVICDVCGETCGREDCVADDPSMFEYAVLEGMWGYCSRKDGEYYKCEMCENCFDKVKTFIDLIKS